MKGMAIAASVAGLAIAIVATVPAAAKAPGANGQIAFGQPVNPADQTGDVFLYTANPDGTGQKQLLTTTDSCCPAWSPDGRKLAVGYLAPDRRITTAIVNPDGSGIDVKPLADPTLNLLCSAWSPDGSRLACSGWDDLNKNRPRGIFTVRASDWGDLHQLTTNPDGANDVNDDPGDYSPDGKRIVFMREGQNDQNTLDVVSTDGSGLKEIESSPVPDCCSASWSPDGNQILFTSVGVPATIRPDGTGLHAITLKARCPHRSGRAVLAGLSVYHLRCRKGRFSLNPNRLYWVVHDPVWSPDGTKIAFDLFVWTSRKAGKQGVYTANANGSGVRPLTKPVPAAAKTLDLPGSIDWGTAPS